MNRAFNVISNSVPARMEGLSSSTGAIRNKRGDWLSRSKSGILVKALVSFVAASLVTAALIVAVPYITKSFNKPSTAMSSTYHNTVKNGTYEQVSYDDMLKSYGYNTGLEKDALQICELNPESRGELGRGTWSFLHIMASTYPVNPTPEVIQDHRIFFQLLPRIYPCPDCRAHMRKMFHEFPPQINSRTEFMNWLCETHNRVNRRLNKPEFDCTKLDDRWDCGCGIVPGQALNGQGPSAHDTETAKPKKDRESRASRADKKDRESRVNRADKANRDSKKQPRVEKSEKRTAETFLNPNGPVHKIMEIKN